MRSLQDTRGFLVYVLPAVVYTVLIFWLGCTHINITVQQDYVPQDKLEHLGAFGVLTWLAFRALAFELIRLSTGRLIVDQIKVTFACDDGTEASPSFSTTSGKFVVPKFNSCHAITATVSSRVSMHVDVCWWKTAVSPRSVTALPHSLRRLTIWLL